MNYNKIIFLSMFFVHQSVLCMKVENTHKKIPFKYKGTFGELYINNMQSSQEPTQQTIKIKELNQGADLNQNLQMPVFNNQNNNQPVNQNQNLQMPVFNGNQEVNAITAKPQSKPWFSNLSNNWKAFFINVGTGIGAALVDAVVASTTTNPYVFLGYFAPSFVAYPKLRDQLYLRSLKEDGKNYGDIIEQTDEHDKRVIFSELNTLYDKGSPKLLNQIAQNKAAHYHKVRNYNKVRTNLDTYRLKGLLTSSISWILTHIVLDYALGKKSEDSI